MAEPLQLPLFRTGAPESVSGRTAAKARFYRVEVWPNLFRRAFLVRRWGRIGTKGRRSLDPTRTPAPKTWQGR